ncbi:hypothetical protein GTY49_38585 [Streptomyces sp. SID5477]|nr:hypothetical protein [Streptomyces sp. SID5477]
MGSRHASQASSASCEASTADQSTTFRPDGQSMRQHLQAALGVTPTGYRRTFRAELSTACGR